MKWLAVDYGDSRTGLAGCDAGETITSPITPQIEEKSMNKVAAAVTEVLTGADLVSAMGWCVLPYLHGDAVKIVLAAVLTIQLDKRLKGSLV